MPTRRRFAVFGTAQVCVVTLVIAVLTGPSAAADRAANLREQAEAAAVRVAELAPQIAAATAAYDTALQDLAAGTTSAISASQYADRLQSQLDAAQSAQHERIRAVYAAGGAVGLYAGVLDSESPTDVLLRLDTVGRLVAYDTAAIDGLRVEVATAREASEQAWSGSAQTVVAAADVAARLGEVNALIRQAQGDLDQLSQAARDQEAADAAQRALDAARAESERLGLSRAATAQASVVPAQMFALYRAAAPTCPGLPWTVLGAIGQVETGHGRNTNDSYAGAQGPMQFMPRTFAAYGVDGDGDGIKDIRNPADAVFSAARYLCANGGGNPATLRGAIWNYNHANWYVDMVLRIAGQLEAAPPA